MKIAHLVLLSLFMRDNEKMQHISHPLENYLTLHGSVQLRDDCVWWDQGPSYWKLYVYPFFFHLLTDTGNDSNIALHHCDYP